jgi:hypothetical protein
VEMKEVVAETEETIEEVVEEENAETNIQKLVMQNY